MTAFQQKRFSVPLGGNATFRDNYDRIFRSAPAPSEVLTTPDSPTAAPTQTSTTPTPSDDTQDQFTLNRSDLDRLVEFAKEGAMTDDDYDFVEKFEYILALP